MVMSRHFFQSSSTCLLVFCGKRFEHAYECVDTYVCIYDDVQAPIFRVAAHSSELRSTTTRKNLNTSQPCTVPVLNNFPS